MGGCVNERFDVARTPLKMMARKYKVAHDGMVGARPCGNCFDRAMVGQEKDRNRAFDAPEVQ